MRVPMPSGVSVALPVHRAPGVLPRALRCIAEQTLTELDVLVVLNGSDEATLAAARTAARGDERVRVIELEHASLPAALNVALREARHELVARMDADDTCPPTRLALQAAFMAAHPAVVALGTAFEGVDEGDTGIGVERPPCEPAELRWRLCLGNCLCHGSMMLRRSAVLEGGGYDDSLTYAQDYDLWLRLSRTHDLANLPHVLYRYRTSLAKRHEAQASAAAGAMIRHWATLPALEGTRAQQLIAEQLARATWGGQKARAALAEVEAHLSEHGPTPQALMAWQWIAQRAGATSLDARDLEKLERLREAGRRLRSAAVESVWLYGAGRHTAWLLENRDALGVTIAGVADDSLSGTARLGFDIVAPTQLPPRAHVLLSSDAHEQSLWSKAGALRERGVTVWRLYTRGEGGVAISASGISPPGVSIGA